MATSLIIILFILNLIVWLWNFTTVESGNIKFVVKGEQYHRTIDPDRESGIFGIGWHWVGLRKIYRVHQFMIDKNKTNPDRDPEKPKTWVLHENGVLTTTLRKTIPIPYLFEEVELADRSRIDLLGYAIFEIQTAENAEKFVFGIKASSRPSGAILGSKVSDIVKAIPDLTEFISKEKGEGAPMFKDMLEPTGKFNTELEKQTGLTLVGFYIADYNAAKDIVDAANEETVARLKAKAVIATAEGNAQAITIQAKAKADEIKMLQDAELEAIDAQLVRLGISGPEKARILGKIKMANAIEKTKLTTLVLSAKTGTNLNI